APGPEVVRQLGVGGEGIGKEARCRAMELLASAPADHVEAFLVARRRVSARSDGNNLVPRRQQPLSLRAVAAGRGVTWVEYDCRRVGRDGYFQIANSHPGSSEVPVGLGDLGIEFGRLLGMRECARWISLLEQDERDPIVGERGFRIVTNT